LEAVQTYPPPLPAIHPATIVGAIDANITAYLLSYATLPGASLHHDSGVAWVDSGLPSSVYNAAVAARFDRKTADAGIESVLAHFRRVDRPFTWHIGPTSTPDDLGPRLLAKGFEFGEDEPGMAASLEIIDQDTTAPKGLEIDVVADERTLRDWVDVWLFPLSEDARQMFRDRLSHRALSRDGPWRYYVGRLDGRPVATVERFAGAGVVSIQYVVTLPEARRRGIGAAMTRHAMTDARHLGYHVAVLTASPDGVGIYRRLGFREYCRFTRYEWVPGSR
jgi:ribosomal protein S18 acetylase RimI-like enzyme